jgi:hypothetical protein
MHRRSGGHFLPFLHGIALEMANSIYHFLMGASFELRPLSATKEH